MDAAVARQLAIQVVDKLEAERSPIVGSYVVFHLLNRELSKYVTRPPVVSTDPITDSVQGAINRIHPNLSVVDSMLVQKAMVAYLDEIEWADQHLELQEAIPRRSS